MTLSRLFLATAAVALLVSCGSGTSGKSKPGLLDVGPGYDVDAADAGSDGLGDGHSKELPGTDQGGPDGGADGGPGDGSPWDGGAGDAQLDLDDPGPQCEGEGGFMCPCDTSDDCVTGLCVGYGNGKVCSQTCYEDCPTNWVCTQDPAALPDIRLVCQPRFQYLCMPCSQDSDCTRGGAGDFCVNYGDAGAFCGTACDENSDCPGAYACADSPVLGGSSLQCFKKSGVCNCAAWMAGNSPATACTVSNDYGFCQGFRRCAEDGLGACDASVPAPEACDGKDNNCDGLRDPEGSEGCTPYFHDGDQDAYGAGQAVCLCAEPDWNWSLNDDDCDDLLKAVNPLGEEVCNGLDDDCNGLSDDTSGAGCLQLFHDADLDGHGDPLVSACVCAATPGWAAVGDDCDDGNGQVFPGAPETCDLVDSNCDGSLNDEGAKGCRPWFMDNDEDGFGLTDAYLCLCEAFAPFTTLKPGDCDDTNDAIKPTAVERCDGVDNNCNGSLDDGPALSECPAVPGGVAGCLGSCAVVACNKDFYDLDKVFTNGCECDDSAGDVPLQSCEQYPTDLGDLPDNGAIKIGAGKLLPGGDTDWFKVRAVDEPNPTDCNRFHFKVRFTSNPGGALAFALWKGSCNGLLASELQVFDDYVDFFVPVYMEGEVGGECGCALEGESTSPSRHRCQDHSATYYIKVFRRDGQPVSCESYELTVSNGPVG